MDMSQLPPEYAAQLQALRQRQQMAQMLSQQSFGALQQPTQMVGNRAVKTNPLGALAQALAGGIGAFQAHKVGEEIGGIQQKSAQEQQAELARVLALPPDQRGVQAAGSRFPGVQSQAGFLQGAYNAEANRGQARDFKAGDWERADRGFEFDQEKFKADSAYRAATQERLNRELDDSIKRGDQTHAARLAQIAQGWARVGIDQKELGLKDREVKVKEKLAGADGGETGKPMPPAAVKLQNEEVDAIQTAQSINADLGALGQQLTDGSLKLGPAENLMSYGKNFLGMSDTNSKNFSSMQATLKKLQNDSLRLNKGVQTEGDAVRAWNELFENVNDQGVVKQRLEEIQKINERASNLRKIQVDLLRKNYGKNPLEIPALAPVTPALGGAAPESDLPPGVRRVK